MTTRPMGLPPGALTPTTPPSIRRRLRRFFYGNMTELSTSFFISVLGFGSLAVIAINIATGARP